MKTVAMFFCGGIVPVQQGSDRFIYELAHFLNSLPDVRLKLIVAEGDCERRKADYSNLASEVVWLDPPKRWCFVSILNKVLSRCGVALLAAFFTALTYRRNMMAACHDADLIVINYAMWFPIVPRKVRKQRTVCITHDIVYYRLDSFTSGGVIKKLFLKINQLFEHRILKSFRKAAVLADYEKDMLLKDGFPVAGVIRVGVPFLMPERRRNESKKYDFMILGGRSYQNEETARMFFERVVPLLGKRECSVALVGGISDSKIWKHFRVPDTISIYHLGYVDDVGKVCAQSKIGVGTVPKGSGVKIKVVEMSMNGLPVVVSDHGAEGIPLTRGGSVNIEHSTPEEVCAFVEHWLSMSNNDDHELEEQASLLRKFFSPQNCLQPLYDEICRCAEDKEGCALA